MQGNPVCKIWSFLYFSKNTDIKTALLPDNQAARHHELNSYTTRHEWLWVGGGMAGSKTLWFSPLGDFFIKNVGRWLVTVLCF